MKDSGRLIGIAISSPNNSFIWFATLIAAFIPVSSLSKNINISLKNLDEMISLIISDNGLGKDSIYEGFGLKHIRERIEMLAGEVEFFTEKDKGFTINAVLPVRKK